MNVFHLENVASDVDVFRVEHVDVRAGDGGPLVERDHVFLGQRFSALSADSGTAPLERPDDGARRRFLVVVEVVFGELDLVSGRHKTFVFFFKDVPGK